MMAIILGVSLLIGINIAANGAMTEFTKYISRIYGETDMIIRYGNRMPFCEENKTLVEGIPEVETYVVRTIWPARLYKDTLKIAGLVGIETNRDWEFVGYNITGSRNIQGTNVVIGNVLAENHRLKIGDTFNLTIRAYDTETWNRTYSLSVIGIYHPTPPATSIDIFTNLSEAKNMSGLTDMVSSILVKVETGKAAEVREELRKRLQPEFDVVAPRVEAQQRIVESIAGFQVGLGVMVMMALVVSGFLVFNTMFMTVSERTYEIGVMRAIGNSRRQIFLMFLNESLLIGFLGAFIGIFAGLGISNIFALLFEQAFFLPKVPVVLTFDLALSGFITGLIMVILGALYPAVSASRINVIQALRPVARAGRRRIPDVLMFVTGLALFMFGALIAFQVIRGVPVIEFMDIIFIPTGLMILAAVLLKRAARVLTSPVSFVSRSISTLLSRNVTRKLLRNAVNFGIIGMVLTLVIFMGGLREGVVVAVENGAKEAWGADIVLRANQTIPRAFVSNLSSMPEVRAASAIGWFGYGTKVFNNGNESKVAVVVIEPDTFHQIINYTFIDSRQSEEIYQELSSNNESLIMPQSMADKLGVSTEENLTVLTAHNERMSFKVVGVFTGAILTQIWFGEQPMSESILLSFATEKAHFNGMDNAILFFVNLKSDYKDKADDVVRKIDAAYPNYDFGKRAMTFQSLLSQVKANIDQLFSIFLLGLYLAILIGTMGIAITMIMNVTERKREIGLLRSQGMTRSQILILFLTEAISVSLLGFLIALPSALLILKAATGTADITGFWLPYIVPWSYIGQSIIFALIAATVGALYPAYKASKLNIVESLQRK
jgi:putative ABC transport system permease protein